MGRNLSNCSQASSIYHTGPPFCQLITKRQHTDSAEITASTPATTFCMQRRCASLVVASVPITILVCVALRRTSMLMQPSLCNLTCCLPGYHAHLTQGQGSNASKAPSATRKPTQFHVLKMLWHFGSQRRRFLRKSRASCVGKAQRIRNRHI